MPYCASITVFKPAIISVTMKCYDRLKSKLASPNDGPQHTTSQVVM